MSNVHCHLYVSWLQPAKDFTRASTMEPPGVLGHPSHCELHQPMLWCRVLAKQLTGSLSAIPHLILIYQLNNQPNNLSVTKTPEICPITMDLFGGTLHTKGLILHCCNLPPFPMTPTHFHLFFHLSCGCVKWCKGVLQPS